MHRRILLAITTAVSLAAFVRAGDTASGVAPLDRPAFDQLADDLGPYLDRNDPLGFDLKVQAASADAYTFWRGSKGLFFRWCTQNTADWLADKSHYVVGHGDLHFGNIGSYPSNQGWGRLALGMIDFDESARLPFQLELLQGLITMDLLADDNSVELSPAAQQEIHATLLDAYAKAVVSGKTATELLASDAKAVAMLQTEADYAGEIKKYTKNGHFKAAKKDSSNILTPVDESRWPAFADAITEAARHDARLASMLKVNTAAGLRGLIKDVAHRARLGSSGSQGLEKYFILLDHPFKNYDGDVILYLKREIPTAAERAGAVPLDTRSPGERYAEDMATLTDPPALLCSWASLEGKSFWVTIKEPWSDEYPYKEIQTFTALKQAAVLWGNVAGAAHARSTDGKVLAAAIDDSLRALLEQRAAGYERQNAKLYQSLINDLRLQKSKENVAAIAK